MEQIQIELREASKDLYMLSETDAPFEFIDFGKQPVEGFSSQKLLTLLNLPSDTTTDVKDVNIFLRNVTTPREGATKKKMEEISRFQKLQELLNKHLSSVKVYRLGEIRIDVYILGWTTEGHLAGLKTFQVQT